LDIAALANPPRHAHLLVGVHLGREGNGMIRRGWIAATLVALCPQFGHAQLPGGLMDHGKGLIDKLGGSSGSGSGAASGVGSLSTGDIAGGLKDALRVGTERVVGTLGRSDGFNASPDVHIPLPGALATVKKALSRVGAGGMTDELELRLNRAAEAATPRAKTLFWNAIQEMTLDDARGIYNGPKDSATQYFRTKMSSPLAAEMKPIVDQELANVGAVAAYDQMMGKYRSLPFMPDAKADLTQYVLGKAIDGIFLYLGREEAAIRENPAKRTTALLQRVFGAN
jgi:Protein of unknown function (DUF4197)